MENVELENKRYPTIRDIENPTQGSYHIINVSDKLMYDIFVDYFELNIMDVGGYYTYELIAVGDGGYEVIASSTNNPEASNYIDNWNDFCDLVS